jgi:hypothetical protein
VKLRLSGVSHVKCWVLTNDSANIAIATFKVNVSWGEFWEPCVGLAVGVSFITSFPPFHIFLYRWIAARSSAPPISTIKYPGPNGIPNRVLRHLPKRAISFLTKMFNTVLRRQYFPPVWKNARVVSIAGKGPHAAFFFLTHKSTWHCWQALREDPTH